MNCKKYHSIILSVTCHGLGNFPPLIHIPPYPFVNFQNARSGVGWVIQEWGEVGHTGVGLCEVGWVMLGWVGHTGVGWGESCSKIT